MGGKAITEEVFNKVKTLIEAGISIKQTSELLALSRSSVGYIKKSATYQDYRNFREEVSRAKSATGTEQVSPENDIQILLENIKQWHDETNLLLNDLKKRLEFIENNMEIPSKGIFGRR